MFVLSSDAASPSTMKAVRERIAAEVSEARIALADRLEAVASPDRRRYSGRRDWLSDAALFDAEQEEGSGGASSLIEIAGLQSQLDASRGALVAQKRAALLWVANLRKELAANRMTIDSQKAALAVAGVDHLSLRSSPQSPPSPLPEATALSLSEQASAPTPPRFAEAKVADSPALMRAAADAFDIKLAAAADEAGKVLAEVSSNLEAELYSAHGALDTTRAQLRATTSQLERARIATVEAEAARGAAVEALRCERAVATARQADASSRYAIAQRLADQLAADKASLEALVGAKSEAVAAHAAEARLARDASLVLRDEAETLRAEARATALARDAAENRLDAVSAAALRTRECATRSAAGFDTVAARLAASRDREAALAVRVAALDAELAELNEQNGVLVAAASASGEAERVLRVELAERAASRSALRVDLDALKQRSTEWDSTLDAMEEKLRLKRDALAAVSAARESALLVHAARGVELGDARQRAELAEEERAILAAQLEAEQTVAIAASATAEETERAAAAEGARRLASAEHAIARLEQEAADHEVALETARASGRAASATAEETERAAAAEGARRLASAEHAAITRLEQEAADHEVALETARASGRAASATAEETERATAAEGARRLASAEHAIARLEQEMLAQASAAQAAARTAAEQQNAARARLEATNDQRAAAAAKLSATAARLTSEAAVQQGVARAQALREIALAGALQRAAEAAEAAAETRVGGSAQPREGRDEARVGAPATGGRAAVLKDEGPASLASRLLALKARFDASEIDEATLAALKLEMMASEVRRERSGHCAVDVATVVAGEVAQAPAAFNYHSRAFDWSMAQPRLPPSHFEDRVAKLPSAPAPQTRALRGAAGASAGGDGADDDALRGAGTLVPASAATKARYRTDWVCKLNVAAGSALDFVVSLPLCKRATGEMGDAFAAALASSARGLGFALSWQLSVEGGAGVTVGVMCATDDEAAAVLLAQSKRGVVAPVSPPGTPGPGLGASAASAGRAVSAPTSAPTPLARGAACGSSATVGRSTIPWSEFSGLTVVRPLAAARTAGRSGRAPTVVVALPPATRVIVLRIEHNGGWCVAQRRRACHCIPPRAFLTVPFRIRASIHSSLPRGV